MEENQVPSPETPEEEELPTPEIEPELDTVVPEPVVEEEPAPAASEPVTPEPVITEPAPTPVPAPLPEKKEMSRFRKFIRKALLWVAGIGVVYLAGILTMTFIRLNPALNSLDQAQEDLDTAAENIADLEFQLALANEKIAELEGDQARLGLLDVMRDVLNAQIALLNEDVEAAKAALSGTSATLDSILPYIETIDETLATTLPSRLNLILANLEEDTETASLDLSLFLTDLQELEDALLAEE